jgi:hypothetical protein
MAIGTKLVGVSETEWGRWGYSTWELHKTPVIVGKEKNAPYVGYVNDYWKIVGKPTWNGATPEPWSAAFISFCFKTAGAAKNFPYAAGHVGYCSAILKSPKKYPLTISDPATTKLQPGDLVWAARSGDKCALPPTTYAKAMSALSKGAWFCSHVDIVVELGSGEVHVIGGNVSNSVTKVSYVATGGCISDTRRDWIGVLRPAF